MKRTKQHEAIRIMAFCHASGLVEMAARPLAPSAATRPLSNMLQRGSHAKRAMKLPAYAKNILNDERTDFSSESAVITLRSEPYGTLIPV